MGIYLDPTPKNGEHPEKAKMRWLEEHATPMPSNFDLTLLQDDEAPLCHVDNGPFTALGVCYSAREFKAFTQLSDDHRPRAWWKAKKRDIEEAFGQKISWHF